MRSYAPVLLLLIIAVAFPVVGMLVSRLLRPKAPSKVKCAPYECGIPSSGPAREKLSVHFYLVAVMFLVFDVETVFLLPWAVQAKQLGLFGLIEVGLFLFLLLVGYFYIWSKGALTWE